MDQRHGTPVPSVPTPMGAMITHTGAIMNVRLYDGSVRCGDHFDASSYASTTTDPCAYCPQPPFIFGREDAEEWEGFLSVTYRATVRMGKGPCAWCSEPAMWDVSDGLDPWTDPCCTEHKEEWFPGAIIPVSLHKVVTRPVPAEWELVQRRNLKHTGTWSMGTIPLPCHREGLRANDLITFAYALSLQPYLARPRIPYSEMRYDGRA